MGLTAIAQKLSEKKNQRLQRKVEEFLLQRIEDEEQSNPGSGHRFHLKRYLQTFELLPNSKGELLDLGGSCGLFGEVLERFSNYNLHFGDHLSDNPFNFEKDRFPFEDDSFDIVLFMEVIEHLGEDPMHAMAEINRVTKQGGYLLITTPNISSWKAIRRALNHEHPELFPPYMRHGGTDRHNREYTFKEIGQLINDAGFDAERIEAIDVYDHLGSAEPIDGFDSSGRGDTTFCLCRKTSAVRDRMPNWLYWPLKEFS